MPSAPPTEEEEQTQQVRSMQRLALAASPDGSAQWASRPAGAHTLSPPPASGAEALPSRISVSLFGASLSCGSSAMPSTSPLPASGTSPSGIARAFSVQQAQQAQQLAQQHPQAGSAAAAQQPATTHIISHNDTSVLSLAVDEASGLVFSGSQCEDIFVWDLNTYQERTRLIGHTASVLALELCAEKGWLFSASGDSTVRIWDVHTLSPLFVIYPADERVGDIFALKWCAPLQTLYFGCQNTSLQWISLASLQAATERSGTASVPIVRPHKFFDSGPHGGGGSQTRLSVSASSTRAGTPVAAAMHTPPLGIASSPAPAVPRRGVFERASTSPDVSCRHTASSPFGSAPSSPGSAGVPLMDTSNVRAIQLPARNMLPNAHHGYVYALELLPPAPGGKPLLVSGSGDEDIKLWICTPDGLIEHGTLHHSPNGVLALAAWDRNTLFAGLQGGEVEVWDVETARVVRTLPAHSDDVLALLAVSMPGQTKCLFSASADGSVRKWDASFKCVTEWRAHQDAIVLSLASLKSTSGSATLITGASDNLIKIWNVPAPAPSSSNGAQTTQTPATAFAGGDALLSALAQFVSFRSVSAQETLREDCRQCAHWLKAHLSDLGAETSLLAGAEGRNPLVLATFRACGSSLKPRRRVVAYAHYDVVAPGATERWTSDPWSLAGRDGYLFARGVSDNKGPCLAIAHATAELMREGKLQTDVVLLVEGEEEAGGSGFLDAVRRAREQIGDVDVVLLSNSYWLGEDTPCLTVGLRGVVQAEIEVRSGSLDMHSGVDGGAMREPMIDMVKLLSSLSSGEQVLIPTFYDSVRPVSASERASYAALAAMRSSRGGAGVSVEALMARWRHPSLSVHRVNVSSGSGGGNASVIPARVTAAVSLRLVPDQDLRSITDALVKALHQTFEAMQSPNSLQVVVRHQADWWLGIESAFASALAKAVEAEWGIPPVSIREGGSIPALAILEKELGAPAVHLPMGQASDCAHLADERLRLVNLRKGKDVLRRWLCSESLSAAAAARAS